MDLRFLKMEGNLDCVVFFYLQNPVNARKDMKMDNAIHIPTKP